MRRYCFSAMMRRTPAWSTITRCSFCWWLWRSRNVRQCLCTCNEPTQHMYTLVCTQCTYTYNVSHQQTYTYTCVCVCCETVFRLLYGDQRWHCTLSSDQLKAYLFHIWCVDEQKEHPPPTGSTTADLLTYIILIATFQTKWVSWMPLFQTCTSLGQAATNHYVRLCVWLKLTTWYDKCSGFPLIYLYRVECNQELNRKELGLESIHIWRF